MTAVERYNALDGQTVKREDLQKIAVLGAKQGQTKISLKLFKLLEENEDAEFDIEVGEFALDEVPADALPGLNFAMPEEDFEGLGKAVSPDEIYQMITDKMLDKLKEASGKGYKKKWKTQNEEGYLLPFNFDSKKMYRGINIPLLTNGMTEVLKNPYFLTFNQIEKHGGKLKKGSKGLPVVYFTMLYAVDETDKNGEKIQFGTYNKKKFIAWLNKNIKRLRYSFDYYKNSYIPILKYYNVFNGADVEGIDFDLENFKIGFQKGTETIKNNDSRVEIADLIIANYPKPQPLLKESKNGRAYYSHNITGTVDEINMPKFEDFETGLDYYRTLLHEFTHSTGVKKRLDRPMGGKFGSKPYAKEELVAEFGAVFLSAHAGIMWYNQSNHAEYLKNWNNALTHIKDDNRFIMRAASKAQEAADYILNLDKEGVPAYQNSLKRELKKGEKKPAKKKVKSTKKPKEVSKPKKSKKKNTNDLLDEARKAKLTAKTKGEFEKALKKLGFEIAKYDSDQVNPQHWEREYILNFKDIGRVDLYLKMDKEGKKEFEGEYEFKGFGLDAESLGNYKSLPEFYEEILEDFKAVFNFTIKEAAELKKDFSHTLVSKKDASQLGLFGARAKSLRKKKGLKQPVESEAVATVPQPENKPETVPVPKPEPARDPEPKKPLPAVVEEKPLPLGNPNSLAARMQRSKNRVIEYYNIENLDIAKFLGQVEIKEKESVGISITAPQGAGKTRFAFQLINAFAKNYKVGHASMEEHPESGLYSDKAIEYIDPENFANIEAPDINSMSDIEKLIRENDVIVIDSFEKLRELDKNVEVDKDFRKKYDGKLFIFIFQLTSNGKMRGGSKSQFDVDIVLFTEKFDDYKMNYIYPDKNRYNSIPPSELKFSIYNRALVPNIKEEPEEDTPEEVETPKIDTGNLIFTPID